MARCDPATPRVQASSNSCQFSHNPPMPTLQRLRNANFLARFVLVWFALSIGAAIASPMVRPQAMELVCSGVGVMKLLAKTDDGGQPAARHTLDCPLCAVTSAPPPVADAAIGAVAPGGDVLQSIAAAWIAALTAAPLPARGPPGFS